jgi:hypothetical protein
MSGQVVPLRSIADIPAKARAFDRKDREGKAAKAAKKFETTWFRANVIS